MLKKIAFILGIIGSAIELLPNLWHAAEFLFNAGAIDFTNIDTFSSLIYFSGMILLSAAALIGCLLIFRKRKLSGIMLCVIGFLMLVFSIFIFGIIPYISVSLFIAAGVIALAAKDETPADKP